MSPPTQRFRFRALLVAGMAGLMVSSAFAGLGAADSANADAVWLGGGFGYDLAGRGVTVGIFEAGSPYSVRYTHADFSRPGGGSRVWTYVNNPTTFGGHATNVAGIIGGNGTANPTAMGMAPEVEMRSYGSTFFGTIFNGPDANLLDITNHSYSDGPSNLWSNETWTVGGVQKQYRTWGFNTTTYYRDVYSEDPRAGQYSSTSRNTDQTLHAKPNILAFYSAGNGRGNQYSDHQGDGKYVARFSSGFTPVNGVSLGNNYWLISRTDYPDPGGSYDSLGYISTAKNSIVVGAITSYNTDPRPAAITSNILTSFSNWGPVDDGRMGVTLSAPGNGILTPGSGGDTSYNTGFSGTSASSPAAAGAAALVLEHWRDKGIAKPRAATQKALLLHTATDIAINGQVGPDYRTGFGLIDALASVQFLDEATKPDPSNRKAHAIEDVIAPGQHLTYSFTVTDSRVKATLVWSDPAGTPQPITSLDDRNYRSLVNDLDLWFTNDATGTVYYPYTLDPDNPALPATRDKRNDVENIEQVLTDAGWMGIGSRFTLHIGIDGALQGNLPQLFSLMVGGASMVVPEPASLAMLGMAAVLLRRRR